MRNIRGLWVAAILATIGVGAYDWGNRIDREVHDDFSRDVRELQALDARLDGQVMQSRDTLVAHYDGIVRTMSASHDVLDRMARVPAFLSPTDQTQLAKLVADTRATADQKATLVEEFKSENAILRNSTRFFPVAAKRLRDELRAGLHEDRARSVNHLLVAVLEFNEMPGSREAWEAAQRAIEELEASAIPVGMEDDFDIVLRHAITVVDRGLRVDEITNDILAVPTARATVEVDGAYEKAFSAAIHRGEQRRIAFFTVALGAVIALGFDIIVRLRRSAAQERKAGEQLAKANQALLREKERERELSELKSRFVSMTSHEFRTPLSVILSSTELLESYGERWTPAKKADHFARIKNATTGMEDLLDSILVIGKSESGKLECSRATIDLARFTRHLTDTFRPTMPAKHELRVTIDDALDEASVDEKLLNHILTNLLSNAVKYSPAGGAIRLEAQRRGDKAVFVVADQGIGIPAEDRPRIFESFHRCSNVGHIRGTGLGLAVVKRAVDAHGGELVLDSEVGRGTTFTVTLPIISEPQPQRDATLVASA